MPVEIYIAAIVLLAGMVVALASAYHILYGQLGTLEAVLRERDDAREFTITANGPISPETIEFIRTKFHEEQRLWKRGSDAAE